MRRKGLPAHLTTTDKLGEQALEASAHTAHVRGQAVAMFEKRAGHLAKAGMGGIVEAGPGPIPELYADRRCAAVLDDDDSQAVVEPHNPRLIELLQERGEYEAEPHSQCIASESRDHSEPRP